MHGFRAVPLCNRSPKGRAEIVRENEIRQAEVAVEMVPTTDAGLVFIGRIHTPWTSRMETPRQGRADGPLCRIEVFEPWVAALDSLDQFESKSSIGSTCLGGIS